MKEIKITQVTPKSELITKGISYSSGRNAFFQAVTYTLEDGRTIDSSVHSERKKNLPNTLAREQRSAAAGAMSASFDDNGQMVGVSTRWTIGSSGGLVPRA